MKDKTKISSFINEDIAYLLGLIVGRGTIVSYDKEVNRIIVEFPYKSLEVVGISKSFNQKNQIQNSLDVVVKRANNLKIDAYKQGGENVISLELSWVGNDISWQFIKFLINGNRFSYKEFRIPECIWEADNEVKKEFLRGICDVTSYSRKGNVYIDGRHRVYIEVNNLNWYLVADLVDLIQNLGIPVQTIDWGHPNIRNGNLKEYNQGKQTAWAREHQIKIFSEEFIKIGSYIEHKNEVLKEFAEENLKLNKKNKFFSVSEKKERFEKQVAKGKAKLKPSHPEENSERLPEILRGNHFDTFWQIYKELKKGI